MKLPESQAKELLISDSENGILVTMKGFVEEYRPDKWRVIVPYDGKKHFFYSYKGHKKNPKLDSEYKALQLLVDINREIDKGTFDPDVFKPKGSDEQFESAVEIWIDTSDCSAEWLAKRRSIADGYLIPHFKGMSIQRIKHLQIKKFIKELREKDLASKSIYNIIGELKAMMRSWRESIQFFPTFPEVKVQKPPINWIGEEQQAQIFEFIPLRHLPIFTFLKYTGCRPNEARGLLRRNVHLEDSKSPYFVLETVMGRRGKLKNNTKTNLSRPLPIIPELLEVLKPNSQVVSLEYVFTIRGKPYGENTIRKVWDAANLKAHEKYQTPLINPYNGLKHSFGCQRLNDGFSLAEVQAVMGHTDARTTQRYAEYVTNKLSGVMRGKISKIGSAAKTDEKQTGTANG
jgi:integrase